MSPASAAAVAATGVADGIRIAEAAPGAGARTVAAYLLASGQAGQPWQARLLSDGERQVVEYRGARPADALVAKVYPDDGGARAFAALGALDAALRAHAGPVALAVPAALHYDPVRRCLLQSRVDGIPFRVLAAGPLPEAVRAMRRAGLALAQLHALRVPAAGAALRLSDHLRDLMRPHPIGLARALPHQAPRVAHLLSRFVRLQAGWAPLQAPSPIHRDLHLGQMFLCGAQVAVIDWDAFGAGDAAVDVGNLLMVLDTRTGARSAPLAEAFCSAYQDGGGRARPERVPVYRALACLRRACKHARLRRGAWQDDVHAMLAAAERHLESVPEHQP